jgi:uncharacterized protein (DUF1778 family)
LVLSRVIVDWLGDFPNASLFDRPVNNARGKKVALGIAEQPVPIYRTHFPKFFRRATGTLKPNPTCEMWHSDVQCLIEKSYPFDARPTMSTTNSDARINFRLNSELKKTIEDAAAELGQSISDFAISTLVQAARKVLHDQQVTRLSERDRQVFAAMLDDESIKPNDSLVNAAKRYKKQVG